MAVVFHAPWEVSTDCGLPRSAGSRAMNANPVINSNVEFFNTGTRAGGAWRQRTFSARGDDSEAARGSKSGPKYLTAGNCP